MRIVKVEMMQKLDRLTIESGIEGLVLMERAGTFVYNEVETLINNSGENQKVLVLTGAGNNGGDGWVVARLLNENGYDCSVLSMVRGEKLKGDALVNFDRVLKSDVTIYYYDEYIKSLDILLDDYTLFVDALIGTGIKGELRENFSHIITEVNNTRKPIISVDIPSGVNGDTGEITTCAINADITVSFAYPKLGHFVYPGRQHTGLLKVYDIGILPELIDNEEFNLEFIDFDIIQPIFPKRAPDGHKGTFGKGYILAGSPGMTGAAVFSGTSFLRSGAGLVYIGTSKSLANTVSSVLYEAVVHPLPEISKRHFISSRALGEIHKRIKEVDVVVIGPGLGKHHETTDLVNKLVKSTKKPMIIDADGLNAIAKSNSNVLQDSHDRKILTPHLGELSRLLGIEISEIQKNKYTHASKWAKQLNSILIIKGSPTLIANPHNDKVYVNTTGNSSLATAGSGDVLSGIIAGFIAQGVNELDASILGVYIHGLCGDLASQTYTEYCVIARDIIEALPEAISLLINN